MLATLSTNTTGPNHKTLGGAFCLFLGYHEGTHCCLFAFFGFKLHWHFLKRDKHLCPLIFWALFGTLNLGCWQAHAHGIKLLERNLAMLCYSCNILGYLTHLLPHTSLELHLFSLIPFSCKNSCHMPSRSQRLHP